MLRDDDGPERRVEKLARINQVLIDRIDRLEESRGSAWSMFQAAVALEQEVMVRTRDLERALADLSQRNRELAVARAGAEVEDDRVRLEAAPGIVLTIDRRAIGAKVAPGGDVTTDTDGRD